MQEEKKLTLTVPEMAKLLGISRPVAYKLVRRAGFPAVKVSERRIIVPVEALHRWLDDQAGQGLAGGC